MLVMVATALYVGFISPNSQASVSVALRAFGQCRVNTYDCRDFNTQFEAQAVYWACGGRQNDVHRLDRDRDGGPGGVALSASLRSFWRCRARASLEALYTGLPS